MPKLTLLIGLLAGLLLALSACNFAVQKPTPVPSATASPTVAPSPTASRTPTVTPTPSITPTPAPSLTPSITPPPTIPPTPSATPRPVAGFANDQWTAVNLPQEIRDGLPGAWFAIVSANQDTPSPQDQTPEPSSNEQTVYLVNPSSGQKVTIFTLPSSTGDRIYWAPDGRKLVYFLEPMLLPDGTKAGGLYLLNLTVGISLRLFDVDSLNPLGIPDHRPVWSPDSSKFAVALPTGYDVDIFTVAADGSSPQNVTANGSFDLWPAWSPDGRRLAFVSDRAQCPSWIPGEPHSCSSLDGTTPTGGNLFVMDLETGNVTQVSDILLDGPPTWVSNLQIAFTTGLGDPFASESKVWITDIQSGTLREISGADGSLNLGAAWSGGGQRVLYHRASDPTAVVLKDGNGTVISERDDFLFSRFGFAAAWTPSGDRVAFGGRNGQCPTGLIVANIDLTIISGPAASPRACDPSYSPDGQWLAYAGIQFRAGVDDGHLDLFMADASGYGARNLTSGLKGEITLLGWVESSS